MAERKGERFIIFVRVPVDFVVFILFFRFRRREAAAEDLFHFSQTEESEDPPQSAAILCVEACRLQKGGERDKRFSTVNSLAEMFLKRKRLLAGRKGGGKRGDLSSFPLA